MGERAAPVIRGSGGSRLDTYHLTRDVRRARRQEKSQGGLHARLGATGDVDQLSGAAAPELFTDRADKAGKRVLRHCLRCALAMLGRGTEYDDPPAGRK